MMPGVPAGKTAFARAMCPCSTRVYARFSSSGGARVPKRRVRVMSVVPSMYWPPVSHR